MAAAVTPPTDFRFARHGTARLATLEDCHRAGMLEGDGLVLGRASYLEPPSRGKTLRSLFNPAVPHDLAVRLFTTAFFRCKRGDDGLLRLKHFTHVATFAPTGKGKGVSSLAPNLLAYPHNTVTVDPDGEQFKIAGRHREAVFGHKNIVLAPFGLPGRPDFVSATYNPLDSIDPRSVYFLDQCFALANTLVVRKGTEHEEHWLDSAEIVLTAFIAVVAACEANPERRNLQLVRDMVASQKKFAEAAALMRRVEGFHDVIHRLGNMLSWFVDRELGSVLTTVQRFTRFLDSPPVAANTERLSFRPRLLRSGKASLWLCLPSNQLETQAPLMRMWIGCILRSLTESEDDETNPILFLIDEAAHIGHIQSLESAVTLHRKRGIRLWFFSQSTGQLSKCFGDRAGTFLENIDTQQYFGLNSYESAEALSKRAGDKTIWVESPNDSSSRSRPDGQGTGREGGSVSTSSGLTLSEQGRALFRTDEILTMPDEMALIQNGNMPVIAVERVRYHDTPEFAEGRAGVMPPRGSAGTAALCLAASLTVATCGLLIPVAASSGRQHVEPDYRIGPADSNSLHGDARPKDGLPRLPAADPVERSAEPTPAKPPSLSFEQITGERDAAIRAAKGLARWKHGEANRLMMNQIRIPHEISYSRIKAEEEAAIAAAMREAGRRMQDYVREHPGEAGRLTLPTTPDFGSLTIAAPKPAAGRRETPSDGSSRPGASGAVSRFP